MTPFYRGWSERSQENTAETLVRIVSFFGKAVDNQRIQEIVEFSQFSRMQAREREVHYAKKYGRILAPTDPNQPNSFKVRKGKVGSYLDELLPADIDYCNGAIASLKAAA